MQFNQLLTPETVCVDHISQSKTAALHKISSLLHTAMPALDAEHLFNAYWKRELLGSTTIGHGVMIPHIRTALLTQARACFLRLLHPVDFGAEDTQPVDLIFALAMPQHQNQQHLAILAHVVLKFSQINHLKSYRAVTSHQALYTLLNNDFSEKLMCV